MTCTCTHPQEAHYIAPAGNGRVEPCGRTDCPCGDYQEGRRG